MRGPLLTHVDASTAPSSALRVSLSPQDLAGRGTLDRKDAWWVAGDSQLCVPSPSYAASRRAAPAVLDDRISSEPLWMTALTVLELRFPFRRFVEPFEAKQLRHFF